MMSFSARASASFGFPAKRRRRTSGIAAAPAGVLRSRFSPAQIVYSLSWMGSEGTPPKTIAPRRPLPMGRASVQAVAGWRYQRTSGLLGDAAAQAQAKACAAQAKAYATWAQAFTCGLPLRRHP